MVYIANLDNFIEAAQQLFISSPGDVCLIEKSRLFYPRTGLYARQSVSNVIEYLRFLQTRYLIKYRHSDGHLVLKVTDDKVVSVVALDFCWRGWTICTP